MLFLFFILLLRLHFVSASLLKYSISHRKSLASFSTTNSIEAFENINPSVLPSIIRYVETSQGRQKTLDSIETKISEVLKISQALETWSAALSLGLIPENRFSGKIF